MAGSITSEVHWTYILVPESELLQVLLHLLQHIPLTHLQGQKEYRPLGWETRLSDLLGEIKQVTPPLWLLTCTPFFPANSPFLLSGAAGIWKSGWYSQGE